MTSRTNYYKSVSQVYKFNNRDDRYQQPDPLIIPIEDRSPFQQTIIDDSKSIKYQEDEVTSFDNSDIRLNTNNYTRIEIPEEDTVPEISENFEETCTYHNKKANNNKTWLSFLLLFAFQVLQELLAASTTRALRVNTAECI